MSDKSTRRRPEYVIRLIGLAGGGASPNDGHYVRRFDPDAFGGRGDLRTTPVAGAARRFANAEAAMLYWQQQSSTLPVRPDGKANRPLTAYSVDILPLEAFDE